MLFPKRRGRGVYNFTMRKIAYIVPGYGGYKHKKLENIFKKNGVEPIFVKIDWNYKKPAEFKHFIKDFLDVYEKPKNVRVYIFGFSFGASIAFLSASKTKPDRLILASLSPYRCRRLYCCAKQ